MKFLKSSSSWLTCICDLLCFLLRNLNVNFRQPTGFNREEHEVTRRGLGNGGAVLARDERGEWALFYNEKLDPPSAGRIHQRKPSRTRQGGRGFIPRLGRWRRRLTHPLSGCPPPHHLSDRGCSPVLFASSAKKQPLHQPCFFRLDPKIIWWGSSQVGTSPPRPEQPVLVVWRTG